VIAAVSPAIYLLALACPVGMGLMMLFMGRGMMGGRKPDQTSAASRDDESLADLKAEQARLAEKISALEESADRHDQAPERHRRPAG
jgi:DUF2933 family protein